MSKISEEETKTVLRPAALAHLVLRTSRFEEMVQWYQDFLGVNVVFKNDHMAFLQYDFEHHRIAIFNVPNTAEQSLKNNGVDHFAFTYSSLSHLMEAYKARLSKGIKPWWCVNHGMTMSAYYVDPDKNRIENQVDTFKTAEEAHAYMKGPLFSENPIGVDFNPEEIIDRLSAGESETALMKIVPIGPRGPDTIPVY